MHHLTLHSRLAQRHHPNIAELCDRIAHFSSLHRPLTTFLVFAWTYLNRMIQRLDRLATRWEQGRLAPPRIRPGRVTTPPVIHPADAWKLRRAPRGHLWLIRLVQPLVQHTTKMEMLIHDPDLAALCAAAPQAARLLRPLCRMYGIEPPPHLALPPRPKPPTPPRAPPPPPPPPFREHSPNVWPFVPLRLRLKVPGLTKPARRRKRPP